MNGYSVNSGYYGYSMSWGAVDRCIKLVCRKISF